MKKIMLSAFVIIAFILYAVFHKTNSVGSTAPLAVSQNAPTTTQTTPSTTTTGSYKDGSYTGDSANAYYGNVQVKAIIQNGKITDVLFLSYPNDRNTSKEINSQATPLLKSEAIKVQSANVDIVSGATLTSEAFQQSLQSALNQAKA